MPRPKKFRHTLALNLRQIGRAILAYYADRYRHDQGRIARNIIRQYALFDANFDERSFKRFVKDQILSGMDDDSEQQDELKRQLDLFLVDRQADA